jgi:hypothetical protein
MVGFIDHVKKAHGLRQKLGEERFREAYAKHPSALVHDLGLGKIKRRTELGSDILQTFQFPPLTEAGERVFQKILEHHGKNVLDSAFLSREAGISKGLAPRILRILNARGVVKLVRLSGTRGWNLAVAEVWDPAKKEWRKALVPPEVKRKHVQVKGF